MPDKPTQVINLESALAICDGDRELFNEIAQVFFEDAAERMEKLRQAVGAQDPEGIAKMGHALKGLSGNIGADLLKEAALQMERCGKNNDLSASRDLLESLESEYQKVQAELKQILP